MMDPNKLTLVSHLKGCPACIPGPQLTASNTVTYVLGPLPAGTVDPPFNEVYKCDRCGRRW